MASVIIGVMQPPSKRSASVGHFLVMEVLERAQQLELEGHDVVHLEVGEPDFPTPSAAVFAGISALRSGRTHYTHSLGIPPLRDAISRSISKETGAEVSPDRVVVTVGSSAALLLCIASLADPGDEIIVSDPGYPCYANIARTLGVGVVPVAAPAANGYVLDPADVRNAVSARTKAIIVNSPANPTGTITPGDVLSELCAIGPPIVSDEIYAGLTYEGEHRSVLTFDPDAFCVSGFSKRYAMTGWRLGYVTVPRALVRQVQAMQQNLYISPPDFAQFAATAVLDEHDEVARMRDAFAQRRRYLLDELDRIGVHVPVRPQGAFYVFCDLTERTDDSMALALDILQRAHVAVAPGIDFGPGGEGHLRLSYATSLDRITEGVRRLDDYLRTGQRR